MNKAMFQSWMADEVLWWRWEADRPDLNIVCSKAMLGLFDHSIDTIESLTGLYHTPIIALKLQEALSASQSVIRFIASYETKLGKTSFQHHLRVYKEGKQTWVIVECIDVTEMVQLEREIVDAQGRASLAQIYERQALLENQNKIIQAYYYKQLRFLALLSHELRSPLLGIKSMVDLLKDQFDDHPFLFDRLRIINLTTEQMTFLVNDILTYSQTQYDAITLHPKKFSLKETFEYVKQLTRSIAKEKDVFVSLIYIGDQEWVYGDGVRLAQILINLIVNGIKFTRYGGVSVEVTQLKDNQFRFEVTDSGEGILPNKLSEIFDPFVQFKTEGSTTNMGSGLGLSVVKQLVELMGGTIKVSSQIGAGTTFTFYLTLPCEVNDSDDKPTDSQTTERLVEKIKTHPYRVLVVDDSKINRMVLSGFVSALDCDVKEAVDGQQALALIEKDTFDFIFLDIQMPIMDGFEVIRHINEKRQSGALKNLKSVFAITAGGGEELIPQGETLETLGFDGWFVKPINQQQVIHILSESTKALAEQIEKNEPIGINQHIQDAKPLQCNASTFEAEIEAIPTQFKALINDFTIELSVNIKQLKAALEREDWPEIQAKAHYIKGNCMVFQLDRWVGWLRVIELCAQGDYACDNADLKKIKINKMLINLENALKYLEN